MLAAPHASPPHVTVVIPAYNTAPTIQRAIRSAMAQTMQSLEILVADDASTDTTAAETDALCTEDPRIRLIRMPTNRGKSAAMNVMIAQAQGHWIAVLDADDIFHPTRLARLIVAAEAANADLVADNLQYYDAGARQVVRTGFPPFAGARRVATKDLIRHSDCFASFDYGLLKPVITRGFIERHQLAYDEDTRMSEDFYYLVNFFAAGGTGCLVGEALYVWTQPFGTNSRAWTTTGAGPWRYNYRDAIIVNARVIARMVAQGQTGIAAMLRRRTRQYTAMIPYLDAQRQASEGQWPRAITSILSHPATWRLLLNRIAGRALRNLQGPIATGARTP